MFIPDGTVDVLARDMVKRYAADALDRATLFSNALFVLGQDEKSKKWMLVRAEIEKIQAGIIGVLQPRIETKKANDQPVCSKPSLAGGGQNHIESHICILIALVAWSELLWVLLLRA
jgi:hypothetical protein